MKKTLMVFILSVVIAAALSTGCGSTKTMALNSIQLTNQLKAGMTYDEVVEVLGNPRSTQVNDNLLIARWTLQEKWRGYIPHDMIFSVDSRTLISWGENTAAFEQQQAQLKLIADELEKQSVPAKESGSGQPAPDFENDQTLMSYFGGMWYSFSAVGGGQTGGTERKLSLCTDGKFRNYSESGYSGTGGGGWGTAAESSNRGTWRITGSKTTGTIVTTDLNGKKITYKFETCGDGCIYLSGIKYAYAGTADCR